MYVWGISGFCADTAEITDLILDDAVLSLGSFQAIVAADANSFQLRRLSA